MTLDDALELARRDHVILREERSRVLLWPSNADAAPSVRRVLARHRHEVLQLLREADIKVCSSPLWHRPYWRHAGQQQYVCGACERLLPELSKVS
jgi:hypothetical protein